jgi:acyl-CoA thioester hydrolase
MDARASATVWVKHRIPFVDSDAMGIVHHSNYVRYFELARIEFLRSYGVPYTEYLKRGLSIVVTGLQIQFKRPARFDDQVEISCWLSEVGYATMSFRHELFCRGVLIAKGATDHGLTDRAGAAQRIPEPWRVELDLLTHPQASAAPRQLSRGVLEP